MRVELGLVVLFLAVLSQAQNATNATVSPVLNGVDVVAYFNLTNNTAAVMGSANFSYTYQNGLFYFLDQVNLNKFMGSPAQFAPMFGGFCSYALATLNETDCVVSDAWYVYNGSLYMMCSPSAATKWIADPATFIAQAQANWGNMTHTWNTGAFCPPGFLSDIPPWAISVAILGCILVIGLVAFIIIKVRGGKKSEYDSIN